MNKIIQCTFLTSILVSLNIYSNDNEFYFPPPPPSGLVAADNIEQSQGLGVLLKAIEESARPQGASIFAQDQAKTSKHWAEINRIQPQIDLLRAHQKSSHGREVVAFQSPPPSELVIENIEPSEGIEVLEVVEESTRSQAVSKLIAQDQAKISKHLAKINRIQPQIDLLRAQQNDKKIAKEFKRLLSKKMVLAKKIHKLEERINTPEIYLAKIAHRKAQKKEYYARPEVLAHTKAYQKEYYARPETQAHTKEYRARPEVKAYQKAYQKEYQKEYGARPEVKVRKKEYEERPEVKVHRKEYGARPEVKVHRKEYQKQKRQKTD